MKDFFVEWFLMQEPLGWIFGTLLVTIFLLIPFLYQEYTYKKETKEQKKYWDIVIKQKLERLIEETKST